MCAYFRKANLAWLYIESRPAISPHSESAALIGRKVSQSALYIVTAFSCGVSRSPAVGTLHSLLGVVSSILFSFVTA